MVAMMLGTILMVLLLDVNYGKPISIELGASLCTTTQDVDFNIVELSCSVDADTTYTFTGVSLPHVQEITFDTIPLTTTVLISTKSVRHVHVVSGRPLCENIMSTSSTKVSFGDFVCVSTCRNNLQNINVAYLYTMFRLFNEYLSIPEVHVPI